MLFSKYSDVLIKRSAKPRCGLLGMCLLVVLCSHVSWARDLGQFANDYPINEPDAIDSLIGQVKEKVASGEWDKIQQEAQKRLSEQIQNPPTLAGIGSTQKNKTWKWDPSITTREAIYNERGQVIYPAGTKLNPLSVVSLKEPMLFIDANDSKQVALAEKLQQHTEMTVILTGGSYLKLMEKWGRRVFYDQRGELVGKLGISAVPALVKQEPGEEVLTVTEMVP